MYCIYCNEDHGEGKEFSDEHIIPKALGGLGSFTIRACESSNNSLGNQVDQPFIQMFPVNSARFLHNIQSHRGMPTLNLSGMSTIDGKDQLLRFEIQGEQRVFKLAKPSVEFARGENSGQEFWKVSGDPQDVKRILLGKMTSVEAEGKSVRDENGNPLTAESIERMAAEMSVTHEKPSILITLQLDPYDAVRFFSKVALAAGFLEFGEKFGRSGIAQKIRATMNSRNNENTVPPGMIWPLVGNDNDIYRYFKVTGTHVLAFLPCEQSPLVVSLFGGEFTAVIPLSDNSSPQFQSPYAGRVLQIDLQTKRLKDLPYRHYLAERPWISIEPKASPPT